MNNQLLILLAKRLVHLLPLGVSLFGTAFAQTYAIQNVLSGKVLSVFSGNQNGAQVEQDDDYKWDIQRWRIIPLLNGHFEIKWKSSEKVLDVTGVSVDNGAPIQLYDFLNGANQQWDLVPLGDDTFELQSVNSGKVLEVAGYSLENGAIIQQYDFVNGANQKWRLISEGPAPNAPAPQAISELHTYADLTNNTVVANAKMLASAFAGDVMVHLRNATTGEWTGTPAFPGWENFTVSLPYRPGSVYYSDAAFRLDTGYYVADDGSSQPVFDQYGFNFLSTDDNSGFNLGLLCRIFNPPSFGGSYIYTSYIDLGVAAGALLPNYDQAENTSPEIMSIDPTLGFSQNAYGDTDFDSVNWSLAAQNEAYLDDMFQEAGTWEELSQACPVGGPPIVSIPCGVVRAVEIGLVGAAALEAILQASRSRGNQIDSGIQQEIQSDQYKKYTPCEALQALLNAARRAGDTARVARIVKTQKAYGCRNVQKR